MYQAAYRGGRAAVRELHKEASLDPVVEFGMGFDVEDTKAEKYARERSGELITRIDETTRMDIRRRVGQWAGDKDATPEQLRRSINEAHTMSPERADMIARTEISYARNRGNLDGYGSYGVTHVLVYDGDSFDAGCSMASGATWTLQEAWDNPIEHPNCGRSFSAVEPDWVTAALEGEEEEDIMPAVVETPTVVETPAAPKRARKAPDKDWSYNPDDALSPAKDDEPGRLLASWQDEKAEQLAMYDKDGKLMWASPGGTERSVRMPSGVGYGHDGVIIHSHPSLRSGFASQAPSIEDLMSAGRLGVREIRVLSSDGTVHTISTKAGDKIGRYTASGNHVGRLEEMERAGIDASRKRLGLTKKQAEDAHWGRADAETMARWERDREGWYSSMWDRAAADPDSPWVYTRTRIRTKAATADGGSPVVRPVPKAKATPKVEGDYTGPLNRKALDDFDAAHPTGRAEFEEAMKDHFSTRDVHIRVDEGIFRDNVLPDGRFKSQFETRSSGGALDPKRRRLVEKDVMGVGERTAGSQRPIYGYMPADDITTTYLRADHTRHYGDTIVRLKPGVKNRTTFTHGDSLDQFHGTRAYASPVNQPRAASVQDWAVRDGVVKDPFTGVRPKALPTGNQPYWEAQVHGGVRVDDIGEVVFTYDPVDMLGATSPSERQAILNWLNRPVRDQTWVDDAPELVRFHLGRDGGEGRRMYADVAHRYADTYARRKQLVARLEDQGIASRTVADDEAARRAMRYIVKGSRW